MDDLALRASDDNDQEFLFDAFSCSRQDIHQSTLSDIEKDQLLRFQFAAQTAHYHAHFPNAQFLVVELKKVPIGRLFVEHHEGLITVLDIVVLPQARRKGVARKLMGDILNEAQEKSMRVRLCVDTDNQHVEQWYRRLGFVEIESTDVYRRMEWTPV